MVTVYNFNETKYKCLDVIGMQRIKDVKKWIYPFKKGTL